VKKHSIVTRIMPVDVMRETLRRFDRHRRQLLISELVDGPGRAFQLAFQIGLTECGAIFETIINRAGPLDDTPRRLTGLRLANYFAAAVMMPYQAFHAAAEALSYDVHVLAQRFAAALSRSAPPDHAAAAQCARRAVLPVARRQCRQRLQAVLVGHLSVLEISAAPVRCGTCIRPSTRRTAAQPVMNCPDGTRYFSIAQMLRRPVAPFPQAQAALCHWTGLRNPHAARLV